MVAIFTGAGSGAERGSANVLGGAGLLGNAMLGRSGEKVFLNAATGNLMIQQRDEMLIGRGLDLPIGRTYNSQGEMSDDNGDNWRMSTDARAIDFAGYFGYVLVPGATMKMVLGDGSIVNYTYDPAQDCYIATDGAGAADRFYLSSTGQTWSVDGDTQEVVKWVGGGNLQGVVSQRIDASGNTLNYTYGYNDIRVTRITNANGDYVDYTWSGYDITQITTNVGGAASTRVRYGYDGSHRLTSVTTDLTPDDNSIADGKTYVTTYTYVGTSKLVASITEGDGSRLDIGYDANKRVTSLIEAVSSGVTRTTAITYGTNYTLITDATGQVTRLDYAPVTYTQESLTSNFGGWTFLSLNKESTTVDGQSAYKTTIPSGASNSAVRQPISFNPGDTVTLGMTLQAVGSVTSQDVGLTGQYDWPLIGSEVSTARIVSGPGTLQQINGGLWRVTGLSTTQATRIEVTRTFEQSGATLAYIYNDRPGGFRAGSQLIVSNLTLNAHPYAASGGQLQKITVAGAATQFAYDAAGNVTSTIDALGNTTTFTYDSNCNLLTSTDRLGNVVTRTYGSKNELLTETRTGADQAGTAQSHTTRYVYDANDRLVFTLDAEGRVGERRYDTYGQLSLAIEYIGQTYNVGALAANAAPTQSQMNAWVSALSDPTAISQQSYQYDVRGNLVASYDYGASTSPGTGNTGSALGYNYTTYTYDRAGQLLSRTGYLHSTETFVYDGLGRLTGSVDINGGTTSIVFNDAAHTTVVTLASGIVQTSTYNLAGNLISLTESGSYTTVGTATNAYDQLGRLRVATDATGRKSYVIYDDAGRKVGDVDQDGELIEYKYDANDRIVATVRYATALTASQLSTLQNPNTAFPLAGNRPAASASDLWSWNVYDKEGRVIETIDGTGHATTFDYDASGRLVKTTAYYNMLTGSLATFKSTSPTTVVLPAADAARDSVSRIFYDKAGRTVGTLDGEGFIVATSYDGAGRKVAVTAYANAAGGNRATDSFTTLVASVGTSAADRTVRYVYDGEGLLIFTIDALNHVTEFVYPADLADVTGQVRQTIQYAGSIATPSAWTIAGVRTALGNAGLSSNANNRTSWAIYNNRSQIAYAIDATGAVVGYKYDAAGNVTKTTRYVTPRATTTLPSIATMDSWASSAVASSDRITRDYHNARGELSFSVDGEGYVVSYLYDAEGRMVGMKQFGNAVAVNDATTIAQLAATMAAQPFISTATTYDNEGRVATTTDAAGFVMLNTYSANGTLASSYVAYGTADQVQTSYLYDGAGRMVARYDAVGTAEAQTTTFSYDGLGNLLSTTDATGATTTQAYDRAGRVLSTTDALGGVTTYQYDAFDDVVKAVDPRGAATYTYYDTLGRAVLVRDAEDYGTRTAYTMFGEVASVTRLATRTTDAASVTMQPNFAANTADATTSFAYDKRGRVIASTDANNATENTTYNAFGQVATTQNKRGLITSYAYTVTGRLDSTYVGATYDTNGNQVAPSYCSQLYVYDARGNVIYAWEAYNTPQQRYTSYVYDRLNRVIEKRLPAVPDATNSGGTVTPIEYYTYDARGDLIESKDAAGGRTLRYYDKLGRVTVEIDPVGGYQTYSYANIVGSGSTVTVRSYDAALPSLPASAGGTPPAPPGAAYRETVTTYDKLGRQVSQSVANALTGAWNGASYATATGTLTTSWQYDAAGNVVKSTQPNQAVTYTYYDKLGRKTAQVDAGGYMTAWTLDDEGNVTSERRYATATGSAAVGTPPGVATAADDRVTTFTYDKMGRRLTETRVGVGGSVLNAAGTNVGSTAITDAQIVYTYNVLGEVLTKREATPDANNNYDTTTYSYDTAGRLMVESRASYTDQNGAAVTPTVRYFYDALGNLVRTTQGGAVAAGTDRVTTYTYGAGGRLVSMTDPSSAADPIQAVHNYYYDIAGRKIGESWTRRKSDDSTVPEGLSYQYDLAGRLTRQAFATVSGGTFTDAGDVTTLKYNAHGEMIERWLRGVDGPSDRLQEQNRYDALGRLEGSNAGDGVWRYYLYDAAGNRTCEIADEGLLSVSNLSLTLVDRDLATVRNLATANGAYTLGQTYIDGINVTVTRYDARGQAIQTVQTKRQVSESAPIVDIVSSRAYNAFGETVSDTDALERTTYYTYNRMGRATSVQHAAVVVGKDDGSTPTETPTEYYYYDLSGRLIGSRDANTNLTARTLLAGTGYGQTAAMVTAEYHADGGVIANRYDVFGDLRKVTDPTTFDSVNNVNINRVTLNTYDAMGRLKKVERPGTSAGQLVDEYRYDVLGQRTRHWNNVLKLADGVTPAVETTDYDVQGRVVRSAAFGGDVTTISYSWSNLLATSGLGSFGGYEQVTTYANGKTTRDASDAFGHVISHTDMGGRTNYTNYDTAGRIIGRSLDTTVYTYLNTGLVGHVTIGTVGCAANCDTYDYVRSDYGYDKAGQKTSETTARWRGDGQWGYYAWAYTLQNATASYDALGRMKEWDETGQALAGTDSSKVPAAHLTWSYDAAGNIRHTTATYRELDGQGAVTPSGPITKHLWYAYDKMNRVTTSKGELLNGVIARGYQGTDILYDKAGQRVQTATTAERYGWVSDAEYDPTNPYGPRKPRPRRYPYDQDTIERYGYDAAGRLANVRIGQTTFTDNYDYTYTLTPPASPGALKATYSYDLLGRMTRQQDWSGDGAGIALDRDITYDNNGRITTETDYSQQGSDTYKSVVTNYYRDGQWDYALGAVVSSTTATSKLINNSGYQPQSTSTTNTAYAWYDGAVQLQTEYQANYGQPIYHTYYQNNAVGVMASAWVADGRTRSITLENDALGQAVTRDESDYNASGDPHEKWYRFNGKQLGYIGNNGTQDTTYADSIAARTQAAGTGAFRGGTAGYSSYADFDQNYAPINSYEQGSAGGSYTVRAGDSLATIAAQLWGDSSLWYKLAQANGLAADTALTAGQTLLIPSGVAKSANNAGTFNPYNPLDAYGESSPTTPAPQGAAAAGKKNKCGSFGMILIAVVAIAVTIVATAGAAAAISGQAFGAVLGSMVGGAAVGGVSAAAWVAGGVIGGAVGSIVSQGVGVAIGAQSSINWKGVALAGIAGGISGGLSSLGGAGSGTVGALNAAAKGAAGASNLGSILSTVARGALGSAITQGIGVVTGLQPKFDWAGVAAAGIGAGVGKSLGGSFAKLGRVGGTIAANAAGGVVNAATRSVIDGTDFGDNLMAALPDVIGQTVGSLTVDTISTAIDKSSINRIMKNIPAIEGNKEDVQSLRSFISQLKKEGGSPEAFLKFVEGGIPTAEQKKMFSIRPGKDSNPQYEVIVAAVIKLNDALPMLKGRDASLVKRIINAYKTKDIVVQKGGVDDRYPITTGTYKGVTTITVRSDITSLWELSLSIGSAPAAIVAHEGIHILDERGVLGGRNPKTKQESYDTEFRAYSLEGRLNRSINFAWLGSSRHNHIWNPRSADRSNPFDKIDRAADDSAMKTAYFMEKPGYEGIVRYFDRRPR